MIDDITVLIADDHELVRLGLRSLLEAEEDIRVVGEAADSQQAIEQCADTLPQVLLLDLRMPGVGGVEVCRTVAERAPQTSVLVLTSFDDEDDILRVTSAGASGYVLKDTNPQRLVRAIRAVADGQSVFDTAVANKIISHSTVTPDDCADCEDPSDPLSEREIEVLRLMAEGFSNKEIGRALWIGETTVKTHVSHILRKLGQPDRTQAVLAGVKVGLVRLSR